MDGWWNEIDGQVRQCLDRNGAMTPAELGQHLGLSEPAAASVAALLAGEGKVKIALVAPTETADGRQLSF
jgi:hypothetical protein